MNRIPLAATERAVFGKKVQTLRRQGQIPAHVFGNIKENENVMVGLKDLIAVIKEAGETGLIDLKIGTDRVRPVMIKEVQYHPAKGELLHVDFYQVNLQEKVQVAVPIELIGEEAELVHLGEAVILQTLSEVQVEALPGDLIEKIEVDITSLQKIDDAISVEQLILDRSKITVLAEPEEIVVKMDTAVTEEMKQLLEEQEAEAAAAAEEAAAEEAVEDGEKAEGEEGEAVEGEEGEKTPAEGSESTEEKSGEPEEK
jgi:large subunit ribosomal protein L25